MNDSRLSYSMFIDSNLHSQKQQFKIKLSNKQKKIRLVEPKTIYHWIEDKSVSNCFHCGDNFYFFLRKHHCRNCGRIFCYKCSNNFIIIPDKTTEKKRVCDKCYQKISNYHKIEHLVKRFKLLPLTIKDYFQIACVNKKWYYLAMRYFSKFREIQYKLYHEQYDSEQCNMLLLNRYYFSNHNIWTLHLLRSISPYNEVLLQTILNEWSHKSKKIGCWKLMCSRNCGSKLTIEQIIIYLDFNNNWEKINNNIIIQKLLLNYLNSYKNEEIIPYLTNLLYYCKHKEHFLIDFLLKKAVSNREFAIILYWELNFFKMGTYKNKYVYIQKILLKRQNKSIKKQIHQQINLIEYLSINFSKELTNTRIETMKQYFNCKMYKNNFPIITNPYLNIVSINIDKIKIKSSSSKPIVIPLLTKNSITKKKIKYNLLYKKEDLRKEKIIMNIIVLINQILQKEENLNLLISTYNILPIDNEFGFIEIIPHSVTLHKLKKYKCSIQNFINEHNSHLSIHEMKQRFVTSCAAYCVITYILGIGDRHLENIMITKSGILFHIDYGFILGEDPKKMLSPEIRITPEMVDAMGGLESQYYKLFQEICLKSYNCIRRHFNLFAIQLSMLYRLEPFIDNRKYTKEKIDQFIIKKFIPNENYEEAKLKFKMKVENSHNSQYKSSFIDYFHRSNNDVEFNSSSNSSSGILNFLFKS